MLLMGLMLVSVVTEIVSLGAVLPFIGVLAAPDVVFRYRHSDPCGTSLGYQFGRSIGVTPDDRVWCCGFDLGSSPNAAGLGQYPIHLQHWRRLEPGDLQAHLSINRTGFISVAASSEVISGITSKVGGTMLGVLLPSVTLISSSMLLVAIMLTLVAIDPFVALIAAGGFGGSYGLITWRTRRRLRRNSQRIASEHTQVVKALQEGLGGIRDVLLDGTQPFYCRVYQQADQPLRQAQGNNVFVAQSPRYAMEALGMVLIAALAYGLSRQAGGIATALPVLGALALGAQRMLPALQQIYASWASIAGSQGVLADTIELLDQPLPEELLQTPPAPLSFKEAIRFDEIGFRYASDGPWVLNGLNLTIAQGARVGFVGATGSGKSTTMDLLMGLLKPTCGEILVDAQPLSGNRVRAWQRAIAHVPQSIYLADATLAENIAFGVPRNSIDMERVKQAARRAQIAAFIESRSEGYDALVGERGVWLSGGQRQRIGIARALYKEASVLVLDEATSALDNVTERSVMDAIEGLDRDLTILLIAHRLTTVRRCETIVQLENGQVVAQGTYEELLKCSQSFRHIVHAASSA